jgi:hypothetical protein
VSTLYCRSDSATVNGLAAYKLLGTNTASSGVLTWYDIYPPSTTGYYHSQVVKRTSGGSETVLGAYGTGQTTRTTDSGYAVQSATWACPATTIGATDSVVVRQACDFTTAGTNAAASHSTAQNPGDLTAATWTFYRYTDYSSGDYDSVPFQVDIGFGSTSYPTRIEGINAAGGGGASALPLFIHHYQTQGMM